MFIRDLLTSIERHYFHDSAVLSIFAPMGITVLEIAEFIKMVEAGEMPVLDARSESEFSHARLPGALNLPLLNDDERKEVGTIYKHKGKEAAVHTGFKLVGPRFHEIITKAKELAPGKEVCLYCWRGGMRSQIIAWILQMNGFRVVILEGGYKTYRNWVLEVVNKPLRAIILGGPTGSGKTEILDQIMDLGGQVLRLEELANHRGSAFGALGKSGQPSNEHFENMIAMDWNRFDPSKPVWIENESRTIGSNLLPPSIYETIRTSDLIQIQVGDDRRKQRILEEYGIFPIDVLAATTGKIGKRLGPQHLKQALLLLEAGDIHGWLEIVLGYYDKLYAHGSTQREKDKCFDINLEDIAENEFAAKLIAFTEEQLSEKPNIK